jgi:predicted nucleic acid-binding protein
VNAPAVVVDSNIVFAALLGRSLRLRERLLTPGEPKLHSARFLFVELFKHKERICAATALSDEEVLEVLHALLERIESASAEVIPIGTWMEAHRLCRDVDEKDTPFVALALHLDAPLWTQDEELKRGLRAKGFDRFYEP